MSKHSKTSSLIKRPGFFNLKSEWLVFFWCFLIALIFWFLKALEDDYIYVLSYPLEYENLPENRVFVKELPGSLEVEVEAPGWQLAGLRFGRSKSPIRLNFAELRDEKILLPANNQHIFQRQLPSGMEIINIYPDTLYLEHEPKAERKVPVKPQIKIETASSYGLGGNMTIDPDSILVSGPLSQLNDLEEVHTEEREFSNLNAPVEQEIQLLKPDGRLEFESAHVTVNIPVERLTEKHLQVPVSLINQHQDYALQLVPSRVDLTFQVPLSRYSGIGADNFELIVDAQKAYRDSLPALPVIVERKPRFIYSLRLQPEFLDYYLKLTQ